MNPPPASGDDDAPSPGEPLRFLDELLTEPVAPRVPDQRGPDLDPDALPAATPDFPRGVLGPTAAPVTGAERIESLDILRGFALLGILLVNMALFSLPLYAAYLRPQAFPGWPDRLAAGLVRAVAESKFYTLFSFLFGVGFAMQLERLGAPGTRFGWLYARRLLVLLAFGVLHGLLLWFGDILALYALVGFVLLCFRRMADRRLLAWAAACYFVPTALALANSVLAMRAVPTDAAGSAARAEQRAADQEYLIEEAAYTTEVYARGGFAEIFWHRLENHRAILPSTLYMAPIVLSMFLLGLYAGRRRLLHAPAEHRRLWRGLAGVGLPLGLGANIAYAALFAQGDPLDTTPTDIVAEVLRAVGTPVLMFGYVAGCMLLLSSGAWGRILRPIAAVGRMALTNYLAQSVICTTLFYSYGLGWFGSIGPFRGVLLSLAIYAVQIPASVLWLRAFAFGPCEWLWRTLTYGRVQPLRVRRRGLPPPTQGLLS